ncbi:formyl transferase [Ferruginibacter sp. SUN106]|uniref:formyl transferase n=1 Tax=Ferruginibacter sp. SUN106 TaxID=2978348 RepID=UPI003D36ABBA
MMQNKKIVFLASDCESSRWVYNAIAKDFLLDAAIIEQPVSKKLLFKNRVKRIGIFKVLGQVMFSVLVVPYLRKKATVRKAALVEEYQLNNSVFSNDKTHLVSSVNDDACKQLMEQLQPDIVIVNGTRIISKKILQCTNATFINMHVGITPWYRGSHGGYWALYNNDIENFGTTIHLVDTGVDTGGVLQQAFIKPGKGDNFTTYPILQVAAGIDALKKILPGVMSGGYQVQKHTEKGMMYYQPTIWQYIKGKVK